MFSPQQTSNDIEALQASTNLKLRRYTIDECQQWRRHLEILLDEDGNLRKDLRPHGLNPDEVGFIANEQLLCTLDFLYWAERYAWIISQFGEKMLYKPNIAQSIYLDILGEMEDKGIALMIQALKARQLGITTLSELIIAHRVQFHPVDAVVASSDPEKSAKMARIMEYIWENMPWYLLPARKPWKNARASKEVRYRAGELIVFPQINSAISIQWGNQTTGICRGATPKVAHLCLSPETLVRGEDCKIIPISNIQKGSKVLGSDGNLITVKNVWLSDRTNEETSVIHLWNNYEPLEVTKDHKVLTLTGLKEADQLSKEDWILYPLRAINHSISSIIFNQAPIGRWGKNSKASVHTLPTGYKLGRVIGLYLAEGSIHINSRIDAVDSIFFSCHQKEAEEFSSWVKEVFGKVSKIYKSKISKTAIFRLHSSGFAKWVNKEFGHRFEKRIPDWVWDCGEEFCNGLVHGYIAGDGHFSKSDNSVLSTSIRSAITFGMRELIASLGYGWSGIYHADAGEKYGRDCSESWVLSSAGITGLRLRRSMGRDIVNSNTQGYTNKWKYTDDLNRLALKVKRIDKGFLPEFWDLEVDAEDHLFTTSQGIVSNSELCDFENPEELVDASLVRAMHENPKMFLCLESTAKGKDGSGKWWYNTWQFNKDNWPGAARLYPMFLPWYVGTDMYPGPTFLKKNPVPLDWQPPQHIQDHADKAEKFVAGYPLLRKYLGEGWKMPIEQKWYYEANRREYVAKGTLADWFSEMPADDYECFQTSGTSILGPELISEYRDSCDEPIGAFILDGPEIPAQLRLVRQPVSLRRDKPPIPVTAGYRLLPVEIDKYPLISFQNKIFMWEKPEKNEEYAIGVDTAEGVGKDNTVIQVVRKGSPDRHAAQVAEFASKDINAYESWPFVWALANLYSVPINGEYRQAKVVIETAANGTSCQDELKKRGWRKFHIRSQPSRRKYNLAQERLLGWKTDTMTRPIMLDWLLTGIKERALDLNSPKLIDELDMLWLNEKRNGRIEHRPDSHDDRVFALGIALYSLHWSGVYRSASPMYMERQEQEQQRSQYPTYKAGIQEKGTTLDNRG